MKTVTANRPFWMQIRKPKKMTPDQERLEFLRSTPFFDGLTDRQAFVMSRILHERSYSENEFIFEIGQPGAALFFIQEGTVAVEIPVEKEQVGQVAILTQGDFVGELALLDDSPRSASARVVKPTRALALFRNDLLSLAKIQSDITSQVYKALALVIGERLKATNLLFGQTEYDYRKAG